MPKLPVTEGPDQLGKGYGLAIIVSDDVMSAQDASFSKAVEAVKCHSRSSPGGYVQTMVQMPRRARNAERREQAGHR